MSPLASWLVIGGVCLAQFLFGVIVGTVIERLAGPDEYDERIGRHLKGRTS